jgi:serine/threonine protein kinase
MKFVYLAVIFRTTISASGSNSDFIQEYFEDVSFCERNALRAGYMHTCIPEGSVEVAGVGSVKIGRKIGGGAFGDIFSLENQNLVLKVLSRPEFNICREFTALNVLDGLKGFSPRPFAISGGIEPRCSFRMLAMEKLGDADWDDVVFEFDKGFYLRLAKLIEAVRELHEMGFIHRDIKGDNVRVRTADPEYVGLIDFGITRPYQGKPDPVHNRRWDMNRLAEMVNDIEDDEPGWFAEFMKEMMALGDEERPQYEKLITFFREQAARMND